MNKKIVGGLFAASSVNTVLDNLSEQDYPEKKISVIAAEQKIAENYASPNGPWKGKTSTDVLSILSKAAVTPETLSAYPAGFKNGMVCVAVSVTSSQVNSVSETLKDTGGTSLFVL